jgi:Txe/YoeB family toxin of Txe-Axe toxin-antitoxin module
MREGLHLSGLEQLKDTNNRWSYRVDQKNRIIFYLAKDDLGEYLYIFSCDGHYDDK